MIGQGKTFWRLIYMRMVRIASIVSIFAIILIVLGCSGTSAERRGVEGSAVKVAKVDTDYVYEANVTEYLETYKKTNRARYSTFIGFSPDEILKAREDAIDQEIRFQVRRLPGVELSGRDAQALASKKTEELAYRIYDEMKNGSDFADLALRYSAGPTARQGGALLPFAVSDSPEIYQEKTYSMNPGEVTEPFKALDGWRIIKLERVEDDPVEGKLYYVRMILLKPDIPGAEADILDEFASKHTVEVLDPKYNSRRALIDGDFDKALQFAKEAIKRNREDDLAHYLAARTLWNLDRNDEALEELTLAAKYGRISDALIPYYDFFRGEYLEQLERTDEAIEAYHECMDAWRQDVDLALALKEVFERLKDEEYLKIIIEEIEVIRSQDAIALAFSRGGSTSGGVIVTGEGEVRGGSAIHREGYQK
ncbi:MAG: peptidylprolyl isomerase [bacterium]